MKRFLAMVSFLLPAAAAAGTAAAPDLLDSLGIRMLSIPGRTFRMGATEITNRQFEAFRPSHKALRGLEWGLSTQDDEAVVCVSWRDAVAFCKWLSGKTGRRFRLPDEEEWEYACRAGTTTDYAFGDTLPRIFWKHQRTERNLVHVSLAVGRTPPNAWGLCDMHGNVEEWCADDFDEYAKVTRGGSHNTPLRYLSSSCRSAALPDDFHSQIGFRIVEETVGGQGKPEENGPPEGTGGRTGKPEENGLSEGAETAGKRAVSGEGKKRKTVRWNRRVCRKPVFDPPVRYVIPPADSTVPFFRHNHQPALTWCGNGELLVVWFSCEEESGREMVVLQSTLGRREKNWKPAKLFFRVMNRNVTGSALLHDRQGRLLHFNGVANSGDWQNLALVLRESTDDGRNWSAPRLIEPRPAGRHQVIAGPIVLDRASGPLPAGSIVLCCDAGAGGEDGTSVHISSDGGGTWADPWDGAPLPTFREGSTGTTIAGIHAGIVQLSDGSLMAFGRGNNISGADGKPRMPCSLSKDGGRTWEYSATPFPPVGSGQRLVLRRLEEGPLMLVSFTDGSLEDLGTGLFVALSFDDGKTWPVRKLMTDGTPGIVDGGAWTGVFFTDAAHAEPKGYLACTQTPDGMIHLVSSALYYRFNLAWMLGSGENMPMKRHGNAGGNRYICKPSGPRAGSERMDRNELDK